MSTHNMFLWRNKQNYPLISKYPPYLLHCVTFIYFNTVFVNIVLRKSRKRRTCEIEKKRISLVFQQSPTKNMLYQARICWCKHCKTWLVLCLLAVMYYECTVEHYLKRYKKDVHQENLIPKYIPELTSYDSLNSKFVCVRVCSFDLCGTVLLFHSFQD